MHCFYSNVQIYVFGLNLITELVFFSFLLFKLCVFDERFRYYDKIEDKIIILENSRDLTYVIMRL